MNIIAVENKGRIKMWWKYASKIVRGDCLMVVAKRPYPPHRGGQVVEVDIVKVKRAKA